MGVGIVMRPQKFQLVKGKYECKYCNETPKFQLVEVSISLDIASLNEESTQNAMPTFQKNPSRCFIFP